MDNSSSFDSVKSINSNLNLMQTKQAVSIPISNTSQAIESDGVLFFDEIQSMPIESSNNKCEANSLLNRTIDLSNDIEMINDDTTHDSFYDNQQNLDNVSMNSIISNSSSMKLNEYVSREKELLSQANKISHPFSDKKKLYEISNSMGYLSFNIGTYFFPSIIHNPKHSKKTIENEHNSKDS